MENFYRDWFTKLTNEELGKHIERIQLLLDMDLFSEFLLFDECIDLLEILRDECVRRVTGKTL